MTLPIGASVAVSLAVLVILIWKLLPLWIEKRERARFSKVAQRLNNPVLLAGLDATIQGVNQALIQVSEREESQLIGAAVGSVFQTHPPDPKLAHQLMEGFRLQKPFRLELPCPHNHDRCAWLTFTFNPWLNRRGQVTGYIGVGTDVSAHRNAEEDLAQINRNNSLLLHAAGEGIFGLDQHGNISFVNPAAARITGWEDADLKGKPASTILHQLRIHFQPGTQEDHFIGAAFLDGTVLIGDSDVFRRKDGTPFAVEYTSTAIRETGKVVGTVVIFRDITDRKQKEHIQARQARQSALRADVGFALAGSGNLTGILQRCAQSMTKHLEGAVGQIWMFHPDDNLLQLEIHGGPENPSAPQPRQVHVGSAELGLAARGRVPVMTHELRNDLNVLDRDWIRRERLIAFAGFPLMVEGRLIGLIALYSRQAWPDDALEMVGAVADLIAQGIVRKRSEEKVLEQAALLDKSQDAIIVMDLSNKCVYWNKSSERMYGWPAKDVHGKSIDQLIFRDPAYFNRAKEEALQKGEWKGESCQVSRGDEAVVVESQWTLVQDEAGNPKSILMINTDVSERKQIEAQFLRTQRMESIGTLAGGIAHDLNNVLAPIMMSVEILKEKFQDDQSQRMLSIVESSAKRGADMVKQVLTFARGLDGESALLQTRHLIKEVGKIIGETFPKTIKLRLNLAENLWTIMGDATQLHQVMVNLAVNARDAMPEGGTLTITAANETIAADQVDPKSGAKPGSYAVIRVSDTGTGIPPEVLDKMFEPFFTTKEVGKGTGLGLSTVLSIVKNHGGFVQVQTAIHKGTTFIIYLPALENPQPADGEGQARELPAGHGETILAVDDEASVLSMTREMLETFGYRVLTATDGAEAVATYSTHRAEIKGVLTDMLMPFMDGPTTIRVLRKLDPGVKIIAASGLMDNDKVKDSTGLDNITFLMKPYTAEKLLATLHRVLHAEE